MNRYQRPYGGTPSQTAFARSFGWGQILSLSLLPLLLLGLFASPAEAQLDGRIGHTALPTVGRNTGITHLELMPYRAFGDEALIFGDARAFLTNQGRLGGNFGGGVRFLEPNDIFVLGINGYIDVDNTTGKTFQQLGLGLEALTVFGGLHSNFYFPVGNDEHTFRNYRTDGRFSGNQILFDNVLVQGQAMGGVDVSMSVFLPGEFARNRQLELTSGWYQFSSNNVETINGFRIQLDGEIISSVNGQVAVTSDNYFGPNVTLGVEWRFGNRGLPEASLERQMRRFVRRNYNVVVQEWTQSGTDIALTNPLTGEAYRVQHVSSDAIQGDGTPDSPFASLADAQAAGADILFVHADSVLNHGVVLEEGQMLLGGGMDHLLTDATYGNILLPHQGPEGALPILNNSAVHGVTMANNSRVSGFQINGSNGSGVMIDGVENFYVSDVTMNNPTGHGVFINNAGDGELWNVTVNDGVSDGLRIMNTDGNIDIHNFTVNGAGGHGVYVSGGQGDFVFHGDLEINDTQQTAFQVSGLTTTVIVNNQGTADPDDDEEEVIQGRVVVERLEINAPTGVIGLNVEDNEGRIAIGLANINTEDASAVVARDTDRLFIGGGSLSSTNARTVDVEDSLVDIRLQSLFASGGDHAIRMVDSGGRIVVFGTGPRGSGGLIEDTDIAVLMTDSEQIALQHVDFKGNNMLAQVRDSIHFELGGVRVQETQTQFIDAYNLRTLSLTNSQFTNNDLTADTAILFEADKKSTYVARVVNNAFSPSSRRVFYATTLADGAGSALNLEFESNTAPITHANGVSVGLNWSGPAQVSVRNNLINGNAASQTAIDFVLGNTSDNSIFDIRQNGITLTGENSTGFSIVGGAPMVAQLNQNLVQLGGLNGVGMRLTGNKVATFNINQNQIVDLAGGATGILFPTVYNGSSIVLNSNLIDLSSSNAFVDRGIIINEVGGGTDATFQFISNQNNQIIDAATNFAFPAGQATGQLIINGVIVQ